MQLSALLYRQPALFSLPVSSQREMRRMLKYQDGYLPEVKITVFFFKAPAVKRGGKEEGDWILCWGFSI